MKGDKGEPTELTEEQKRTLISYENCRSGLIGFCEKYKIATLNDKELAKEIADLLSDINEAIENIHIGIGVPPSLGLKDLDDRVVDIAGKVLRKVDDLKAE